MIKVDLTLNALPRTNAIAAVRTIRKYGCGKAEPGEPFVSLREAGQAVEAACRGEATTLQLDMKDQSVPQLMAELLEQGAKFTISMVS